MTAEAAIAADAGGAGAAHQRDWTRRIRGLAPLTLVGLFAALPMASAFREPLFSMDEALLLVYPEQILLGRVPNEDFFTSYGPGGLSLLAAVYLLVGPAVLAERAVGLVYHVAIATGLFAMTRHLGRLPATVAGVLSGLTMVPLGLGAYVWQGALALAIWSLVLLDEPRSPRVALASGVIGTMAISWRPEMLVLVLIASLPHLWGSSYWRPWGLGAVVGLIPLAVHSGLSGGQLFLNVAGRVGANSNFRITLGDDLDVIAGLLTTIAAAAYLAWCAYRCLTARAACWAALSVLALPQMLQRMDLGHVLNVACLIVPLAVASGLTRSSSARLMMLRYDSTAARRIVWCSAWLLLGILAVQSALGATGPRSSVTHLSRTLPPLHEEEGRAVDALILRVNKIVPAGAKVFMGARDMSVPTINDMRLYHLLPEYEAYAYNLELPPPQPRGSLLEEDLRQADALILRHVPISWSRMMVPFIPPGDETANDIVAKQFCLADRVYPYDIYVRCSARA